MNKIVTFDRFTVNRAELRLYEDGAPVAVSLSALRLLLALMDRQGAVVTKDELMTRIWGSSPVSENALHVQMAALRRVVGSHLIATKSGVGYRFAGQIKD